MGCAESGRDHGTGERLYFKKIRKKQDLQKQRGQSLRLSGAFHEILINSFFYEEKQRSGRLKCRNGG